MFKNYEQEVERNVEVRRRQQDLVRRITEHSLPSVRNVMSPFSTIPPIPTTLSQSIISVEKEISDSLDAEMMPVYEEWRDVQSQLAMGNLNRQVFMPQASTKVLPDAMVMRQFQAVTTKTKKDIDLGNNPLIVSVHLMSGNDRLSRAAVDKVIKKLQVTVEVQDANSFEVLMFNISTKTCMKLKFHKDENTWETCDVAVIIIDVCEHSSYQEFCDLNPVEEMNKIRDEKFPPVLLLGYSSGEATQRCVPQSTMTILATRLRATYLELFATNPDGIADLLDTLSSLGADKRALVVDKLTKDPVGSTKTCDKRCLLMGLDASGKTSILYKMKLGEHVATIPTIGFNVESIVMENVNLTIWDVGGQDKIRPLWRHYYQNTDALIYVVDASDRVRISENRDVLREVIRDLDDNSDGLHVPIWVLINKSDLPMSLTKEECSRALGIHDNHQLKARSQLFSVCATSGDGLHEAFRQLSKHLSTNLTKSTASIIDDQNVENKNEIKLIDFEELDCKLKRIVLAGLDNSGKTTMLYRLKLGTSLNPVSSTIGYNVEELSFMGHDLEISDLGGQSGLRSHWVNYVDGTVNGLIFVVDSVVKERLEEASIEMKRLLRRSGLSVNVPIVVLANKQDLPGALLSQEIQMSLNLFHICRGRRWTCRESSCANGKGLWESLHWLLTAIEGQELIVENDIVDPNITNKFKTVIMGPAESGKTCLSLRMKGEPFISEYVSTIGVDFGYLYVQHPSGVGNSKVQLWDTSGQERFASVAASYIRGANCLLLVYNVNQPQHLKDCTFLKQLNSTVPVFLVGCFLDLSKTTTSSMKESQIELADSLGLSIDKENMHVVSNLSGEGIQELMKNISDKLHETAGSESIDLTSIIKTKPFTRKNGN